MKKIIFLFLIVIFYFNSFAQQKYSYKEGDIFFQELSCGPFCDAITKVTFGYKGAKFAHVGVLFNENNKWVIAEAISRGVVLTDIDTFLNRSLDKNGKPKVMVGRIKNANKVVIPTLFTLKPYLNKSYDEVFNIKNDKYYCSELVYELYKYKTGENVFKLAPMTFNDPDTKQLFPIWKTYFDSLKVSIPESEQGLNPGSISCSDLLEIYCPYSKFAE
jgi:hypothetical protein